MTSQGSPYTRFQRAMKTRNLHIIRAAAAELPRIELNDALEICLVVRDREPELYEAAAVHGSAATAPNDPTSPSSTSTPPAPPSKNSRTIPRPGSSSSS